MKDRDGDDFSAPGGLGESRDLLKNGETGRGTENRECDGETDIFRARGAAERITTALSEELRPVMFCQCRTRPGRPIRRAQSILVDGDALHGLKR